MRLDGQDDRTLTVFETTAGDFPEVMECYSMTGDWDYMLRIVVGDVRDFEAFLMQDLLRHPAVASSNSHFALKRVKYTTALPV